MVHSPSSLCLSALLFAALATSAQVTPGSLIDQVYGGTPERPSSYTFTKVIHYDLVQRVEGEAGRPKSKVEGTMSLYYTPGDSAYGRIIQTEEATMSHIGDLSLGMRYSLTDIGDAKIGSESQLSPRMLDTIAMSRVSGDQEIEGRMSAHYWYEGGTKIEEIWADSQADAEEVAISRLWPRFEPGFASLATGTYLGLATRWISIDTKFSRDPRMTLLFKGSESLEQPIEVTLEGYVFPVSEADMMRQRLEAEGE